MTCSTDVALLSKGNKGDVKEAGKELLQSNPEDSPAVKIKQHQVEELPSLLKPDGSNMGNNSEGTHAAEIGNTEREETAVHDPNPGFELKSHEEQANDCINGKGTSSEECSRSPNQPQVSLPVSDNDSESSCGILEKQVVEKEGCNLKRNQDTDKDQPSCFLTDAKESAVSFPVKKKRRMGMCGLTEKERSYYLRTQQRDGEARDRTAELEALEEDVSTIHLESAPFPISAEVMEATTEEPQCPHSGDDHRAGTEVSHAVIESNGTGTTINPACLEGGQHEASGGSLAGSELNGNTELIQPAKEEEKKHLENLLATEAQVPEIQIKMGEDFSQKVEINTLGAKQPEESDAEAAGPHMCCSSGTTDERNIETTEQSSSSADSLSKELNSGSKKLCVTSLTSSVPERSYSCDSNDDTAAGPSVAEHTPTRDPGDLLSSGCLDYVSDSQLNTIPLIEEESDGSSRLEDATELICGLIRELSSMNRKVMVAHRELENLRRKPSRSSMR
ncbi:PREDICTED: uncharacterized protein LOC107103624 [Cyprinodon variegatus]|uniref:uncharacterized protein LOC107103624 n=1 Tax=Cyprinodon variegatus TaxID=28743 RepID=UPI00074273CB|nr:PREDICTED: uncharacterized protein LOC107103624 [Cyprinodon variegatus]